MIRMILRTHVSCDNVSCVSTTRQLRPLRMETLAKAVSILLLGSLVNCIDIAEDASLKQNRVKRSSSPFKVQSLLGRLLNYDWNYANH